MLEKRFAVCRRLWAAVLTQAIRDVENGSDGEREQALGWIFNGQKVGNSFDSVCEWLDLDPQRARDALLLRRRFRFCFDQARGNASQGGHSIEGARTGKHSVTPSKRSGTRGGASYQSVTNETVQV
jgi:hypothetical protein